MEFTLVYQGPLRSNGDAKHKHEIRKALHPQLEDLWRQEPLRHLRTLLWEDPHDWPPEDQELAAEGSDSGFPLVFDASVVLRRSGKVIAPLVCRELHLTCALRILLLRPGEPGQIVHGGDLDNRMKTLLDALTVPDENQVEKIGKFDFEGSHFFCLLEDDALVTEISIETDRLLAPPTDEPRSVTAIIRVRLGRTRGTMIAMELT